ncbi:glycosyltransferase family 2 protein [Flavobacterium luteum]|uniref:Glycosyltransferase family 2 protein n=1 Tax=Flavobacterium luteum TaxID=2026654 RepID=A0A7J5AE59_9FLAO|nr:glycosyltransferase family A protein [Flavobacterium luteum]KAB1155854.1 glycosyltransferase family 2 protein [Flavobacterium luteum]
MHLVSIIIPCYNHAKFLPDALQSVIEQDCENWECIVVNDGSTDNTEEIACLWSNKDTRFKYFYKDNGGLSSARNFGIAKSKSEYILTLDSDDKFDKTFISKALKVINDDPKIGIVSCWGKRFVGNTYYDIFKPNGKNIEDFLFQNAAIGNSMFRKKCWIEAGGYDENMKKGYEDWEFYLRISKLGWNTVIIQEPLFFYRQHKTSLRTEALNKFDKEIRLYIFTKHKDLYIKYFDQTVENLLTIIDLNRRNELKRINSIDFKLGNFILRPFRFIKNSIK